ncbi:hypothetical protein ACFSC3_09755 [Sphingomonas floccifaciens]|uniref:DUF4238 domain-containing protein n=1 Tax=Sphingomonas floccifaciens TaxID=1844115 RepID=A0ABW4NE78_9SPHN
MAERSEKTQKGNPHGLTVRQHVFPRASILRFDAGDGVEILDMKREVRRRSNADDPLFCADRAWGHDPEAGWMKDKEDAFQSLATAVLLAPPEAFDDTESEVIGEFYALWQARAERRHLPTQRIGPKEDFVRMRRDYSPDELEQLEKAGITPFRGDGSLAMSHIMGPVIRLAMDRIRQGMEGRRWRVVTAADGEFCVPDVPAHGIIPLSPSVALHSTRGGAVSKSDVAKINAAMAEHSREYLLASSLANCPGLEKLISTVADSAGAAT